MLPILFGLGLAAQSAHFGQKAIWRPAADFRAKVLTACEHAGSGFGKCFAEQMRAAGASPDALLFTQAVNDNGYLQEFRAAGRVGVALVFYPFRANENDGLLLVNGEPPVIDVDEIQKLPTDQMSSDTTYQAVLKTHGNASLWPGDRASAEDMLVLSFPDGSQQFVAGYRVQQGCHACAVLGQAFYSFNFDATGKYTGAKFSGFTTAFHPNSPVREKILSVKPESTFTLLLPGTRGTGYAWTLVRASKGIVLQTFGQLAHAPAASRPGAHGEERWPFHVGAAGEEILRFRYARPWEKDAPPPKQLEISVQVRAAE